MLEFKHYFTCLTIFLKISVKSWAANQMQPDDLFQLLPPNTDVGIVQREGKVINKLQGCSTVPAELSAESNALRIWESAILVDVHMTVREYEFLKIHEVCNA